MKTIRSVMTLGPATVSPQAKVWEAANTMLAKGFSGLPVVDSNGELVGMVSEGDFLRRGELHEGDHKTFWHSLFQTRGALAGEYSKTFGKTVDEVMSAPAVVVEASRTIDVAAALMARHNVKRLPVVDEGDLVGIITRSDIMRALVREMASPVLRRVDADIKAALDSEIGSQIWGATISISVENAVVTLGGSVFDPREKTAARVAAENTSGVSAVRDNVVVIGSRDHVKYSPGHESSQ